MGFIDALKKKKQGMNVAPKKQTAASASKETDGKEMVETKKAEAIVSSDAKQAIRLSRFSSVLTHPLVSEKAAHAEAQNVYTFVVARDTNKYAIKQAVKDIYGVMPMKVRIMNYEGKVAQGGRGGRRSDWKKAVVTLAKGQSIRIHEGV